MKKRHLLSLFDVTVEEIFAILQGAEELKEAGRRGIREPLLPRVVVALLFEKPSLRTRVSFEAGISQLGGSSIYLGRDVGWGGRETIADFIGALTRYVDCLVFRGGDQRTLDSIAAASCVPVVNGLTKESHPCQSLGDLLTLKEQFGELRDKRLAFVGDANNVSRSMAIAAAQVGMTFTWACPAEYQPPVEFLDHIRSRFPQAHMVVTTDPREAVAQAHAVYTDVWTSMGDEAEQEQRAAAFAPYQVNRELFDLADRDAIFLHCLPARRGEEVTDAVIDSPRSRVFEQAENRLHVQKAVLLWLLRQPDRIE